MRNVIRAATVAGAVLAATGANAASLILNGSFETPLVPVGNFTSFPVGGATLTNWSVTGPSNTEVAIVSGSFSQNGVTFNAQDGNQWLDLTGNGSNSTEGVAQIVFTIPGDHYELSFYVGNTTGGSIFGTTSTVNVLLNGLPTFVATNSLSDATGLVWEQFIVDFIAGGGSSTTIGFVNGDPIGDNSNGLDNVVLTDLSSTVVPLPGALPLFATGLAGLGLLGWRRKKRAIAAFQRSIQTPDPH